MKKEDLTPLLYSAEDVLNRVEQNIEFQIAEAEREKVLLQGKITALQGIAANLKYMRNLRE